MPHLPHLASLEVGQVGQDSRHGGDWSENNMGIAQFVLQRGSAAGRRAGEFG